MYEAKSIGMPQLKSTATPERSLDVAIHFLASKIIEAESQLENLTGRLKPVLSTDEVGGELGNPSPGPNCEIEEQILSFAHRIDALTSNMRSSTSRLCI